MLKTQRTKISVVHDSMISDIDPVYKNAKESGNNIDPISVINSHHNLNSILSSLVGRLDANFSKIKSEDIKYSIDNLRDTLNMGVSESVTIDTAKNDLDQLVVAYGGFVDSLDSSFLGDVASEVSFSRVAKAGVGLGLFGVLSFTGYTALIAKENTSDINKINSQVTSLNESTENHSFKLESLTSLDQAKTYEIEDIEGRIEEVENMVPKFQEKEFSYTLDSVSGKLPIDFKSGGVMIGNTSYSHVDIVKNLFERSLPINVKQKDTLCGILDDLLQGEVIEFTQNYTLVNDTYCVKK
jgi:hypothetical protein